VLVRRGSRRGETPLGVGSYSEAIVDPGSALSEPETPNFWLFSDFSQQVPIRGTFQLHANATATAARSAAERLQFQALAGILAMTA
jgi:hypothetical protein